MPEASKAAASLAARHQPGPLGKDNLLSVFEAGLEPACLVLSLWAVGLYFDGALTGAYLILSVLVFAVTFPGTPRLNSAWLHLTSDVFISWLWTATLLILTGFATGYYKEFSRQGLVVWLVAAPFIQLLGHLLLRWVAPFLVQLQGPPRRAIIVGMNEQGVAL
jgi:putative colanic acid biosysnthesis UDP-glucose lipid carrier transferase